MNIYPSINVVIVEQHDPDVALRLRLECEHGESGADYAKEFRDRPDLVIDKAVEWHKTTTGCTCRPRLDA